MTLCELRQLAIRAIKLRISNGEFTERGLARIARISQPHVHKLLKGSRAGSLQHIDRLCNAADVRIDELRNA